MIPWLTNALISKGTYFLFQGPLITFEEKKNQQILKQNLSVHTFYVEHKLNKTKEAGNSDKVHVQILINDLCNASIDPRHPCKTAECRNTHL